MANTAKHINYELIISASAGLVFFYLLYTANNTAIEIALTDSIISASFFFILTYGLKYPVNYMGLKNNSINNILINNFIITILTSAAWLYLSYLITILLYPEYGEIYLSTLSWRLPIGVLLIVIIIILNYVIYFYGNLTEKLTKEAELNSLVKEAELKTLKYQINPHFIFNALNSISSLTISNPDKAREMTINLSEFLRKTLSINDEKRIPLTEELDNINLYLKIEKVRFEKRLSFNFDVADNCKDRLIPNMILQPLVENSIKHGVYESDDKITIDISCITEGEYIKIIVSNNFDPTSSNNSGAGIGLQNINARLKIIYNKSDLVTIKKQNNLFTVVLLIPNEKTNYEKE